MRLNDIRSFNHQSWTHLYEAALFERDAVKLCALIWSAELAILGRERELQNVSNDNEREIIALKKALDILRELGRLSGLDMPMDRTIEFSRLGATRGKAFRFQAGKRRRARMAA